MSLRVGEGLIVEIFCKLIVKDVIFVLPIDIFELIILFVQLLFEIDVLVFDVAIDDL